MFGGGEDSAESQDGQDFGNLKQGSEETDGAERHLPFYQPERKPFTPSVASRIRHQSNRWMDRLKAIMPRATAA